MARDRAVIPLIDLVDIDHWQKIQDHFAQVIGVTIRTVDRTGRLITKPSNTTRICEEILTNSPAGIARCSRCLPPSLDALSLEEKWKEGYECHLGLYNFSIPVDTIDNQAVAYMLIGPVSLGQRKKVQGYKDKIEELGIDQEKFIDAMIEVKAFTFTGIRSVIELISDITCYVVQLGYNRFKLERIIPLPKLGRVVHRFYMDRILSTLLDVSSDTAGTEFGSIMLLNEDSGELYIKVARGLNKDIIKNTRLKLGEGLAGLALKERRFLLLDNKLTDRRIKSRLRRPKIKSALVAPIKIDNQPMGVMNIGTVRPAVKITSGKLETLHRLIELTEATLTNFHKF